MAQPFKLDVGLTNEAPTGRAEILRIAQLPGAIAAEHARAMRAAGEAELPRQCLAELRAWYCPESPIGWPTGRRGYD